MPEPIRISASDGYALGATIFTHPQETGPIVIINSATGVKQKYYARFAQYLCDQGATVITYDYRGIGESRPHQLRGFDGRMRDWGQLDFEGVLRFADTFAPHRERVVLGHSVGGQILGFAPSNTILKRAVTVASQSGYWRSWPGLKQPPMWALWHLVMPTATHAFGYLPRQLGIGEDLPKQVALEWARWCRQPEVFIGDGVPAAGFSRLSVPIQAWSFTDDASFAPKEAVDRLHRLFENASLDRRHVSPRELNVKAIGHFGAFNPRFRDTLWPRFAEGLFQPSTESGISAGAKTEQLRMNPSLNF